MRSRFLAAGAVVVATATLVVGIDSATYAATGNSLIIGRSNTASTTTVLGSTSGPVLDLRPGTSTDAPMKVSGTGRVPNLNADRLDSLDSSQLQRRLTAHCPDGQALSGIWAIGNPACRNLEPTTLIATATDPGRIDTPFAYRTATVPAGRYQASLTATLTPTVRGSVATPKIATCQVQVAGKVGFAASGLDTGTTSGAFVGGTGLLTVPAPSTLDVVCGFPTGTWSFASGGAASLALTPIAVTQSLSGASAGAASLK